MNKKKTIWSGITGVIASVLAFLGVVSCCGMPIIAGILATVGIGASQLSFFAEYRGWFIAFAIVSLIYGLHQAYFKKKSCCCTEDASEQSQKGSGTVSKIFLWIGAVITALALFMETPESDTSNSSGCCPVEETECCGEAITTESDTGCCQAKADSVAQSSCCPSQVTVSAEECCGN